MKTFFLSCAAAAAGFSVPLLAQTAQTAQAPAARPQGNHAAKVQTRADVQAHVQQRFARLDVNRDGFLSQAEAEAGADRRDEKREKWAGKRADRRDPAKMFARLDANNDGKITTAEAEAAKSARSARRGKPAEAHATAMGGLFAKADVNRDGVITRAEFDAAPHHRRDRAMHAGKDGGRGGRGAHMFAMSDANKDGKVSLAEAQQAALQRFDRSDLNRDGTITREERQQARQQMRAQRKPG